MEERSGVAAVRRAGAELAQELGFTENSASSLSIVLTELATNLIKHAGSGDILMRGTNAGFPEIEVTAIDQGPGTASMHEWFRDGYSTQGTSGTGLGAVRRLSSCCDFYSALGVGTVLVARISGRKQETASFAPTPVREKFEVSTVWVPYPGETHCGDAWIFQPCGDMARVMIADGLGHGSQASEAARKAVSAVDESCEDTPEQVLQKAHRRMNSTQEPQSRFSILTTRQVLQTLSVSAMSRPQSWWMSSSGVIWFPPMASSAAISASRDNSNIPSVRVIW